MKQLREIYITLREDITSRWSVRFICFLFLIALLSPFICNELPLISKTEKGINFPIVKQLFMGKRTLIKEKEIWSIHPIIPYSEKTLDLDNSNYRSPFDQQKISENKARHWLGTDRLGRDTLAGLIRGTSVALKVGFLSALLASILGIFLGLITGYFGDKGIRINILQVILLCIASMIFVYQWIWGFFFGFKNDLIYECLAFIILLIIFSSLIFLAAKLRSRTIQLPIDYIISWILEVFKSIPSVFIILVLLSLISGASIWNIIWIIAFVSWPLLTRYTRAEVLKIRGKSYIEGAQVSGLRDFTIIWRHILINAMGPVIVSFSFACAAAIVLEATLSFLGLGLAVEEVTWGSMLSQVKYNYKAWWLVVFPGLAIFLLVVSLNTIGRKIENWLNPMSD
jgi:peptide/nickel transport system permease protein